MRSAQSIRVRGVVQGVGFRPFVFRLAQKNALAGWVLNAGEGVEIHVEGEDSELRAFVRTLTANPPPAACIASIEVQCEAPAGLKDFRIREGVRRDRPTVRISPDLPVCSACLGELNDPGDRRYRYPYINCTNCGPRYSIVLGLPYDRSQTTMKGWPLDHECARQYRDPADRRFHAQPIACPDCGPHYYWRSGRNVVEGDEESIRKTVESLAAGFIVAIKGLGGYHLACDARNVDAVTALRLRKFRKEKPFALMVSDLKTARSVVQLYCEAEAMLLSSARPIVLAPAQAVMEQVAPGNNELGVMLPYTPVHHLLFAAGAPEILVMTSANRSSEPIAYEDEDAAERLAGIADAFLMGERPIARRVDDSIVRVGAFGPVVLRRSRGLAPGAVAQLRTRQPVLAVGADLKNTVTLVVDGQAFVSQHIGDLDQYQSYQAFRRTIEDLLSMYAVQRDSLLVVSDAHPEYFSTAHALELADSPRRTKDEQMGSFVRIQHHRAHIASVLAEWEAWDERVIGVSFDGTGYGDDGTIWGGEIFEGSVETGFARISHLRSALLPGGDAAAQYPVQAAAGFLSEFEELPDLSSKPFCFPPRFHASLQLAKRSLRTFTTTSVGRLFDAAAALLGFTRSISFEGQAAMWLEQLARQSPPVEPYAFPFMGNELDFRPLLRSVIEDRLRERDVTAIARAFQRGVAHGLCHAVNTLCEEKAIETIVLSGGVFQNELLLEDIKSLLASKRLRVWTNHLVPPNDGGISLGQAALAAENHLHA